MKKLILIAVAFVLFGCKVDLSTDVNYSDVVSDEPKTIDANLIVEVMSCSDYQDSRKESETLIEAKKMVLSIFDEAKYVECYREKMNSKAVFKISITVGGKDKTGDIQISAPDKTTILVQVSDQFVNMVNSSKNKSIINIKPNLSFSIKNDINKEIDFSIYGVFINGDGYSYALASIPPESAPNIKLSNASIDHLFKAKFAIVGAFKPRD